MRSSSHFYHFTFSVLFLLGFSLSSHAATIIPGGTTTVAINSDTLNALLPLNPAPLGDATLTPPDAIFPITGGITLAGSGSSIIRHDNSGLGFSLNDDSLNLTDFVINTGSGVLTGSVSGLIDGGAFDLGAGIPLFNIGPGLALSLTIEAGDAFRYCFWCSRTSRCGIRASTGFGCTYSCGSLAVHLWPGNAKPA